MITYYEYRNCVFAIRYQAWDPPIRKIFRISRTTSGQTLAEAFVHACAALDLHLERHGETQDVVPRPKHHFNYGRIVRAYQLWQATGAIGSGCQMSLGGDRTETSTISSRASVAYPFPLINGARIANNSRREQIALLL
jgi:hypothetical protein